MYNFHNLYFVRFSEIISELQIFSPNLLIL